MLKVEMNEPHKKQERITEYPCLGQSGDLVVLFYKEGAGVVVVPDHVHSFVGRHLTNWLMGQFTPFKGELTLSNKENTNA